jgi:flagellar protein FliO/FliZ
MSQLASLLGGLLLILGLIYGLSLFAKRFSQGGFMKNPTIKMLSAMPLGTRERLMLVDVGGQQILLGVTATQINTLHVFAEPVVVAEPAKVAAEKNTQIPSEFSKRLMEILSNKSSKVSS